MALSKPGIHVGVCAPTYEDVRAVCIEGESGIIAEARRNGIEIRRLQQEPAGDRPPQRVQDPRLLRRETGLHPRPEPVLRAGSMSWRSSGTSPSTMRACMPALRKGENPRMMITTTPKRVRLIRELIEDSRCEFTGEDGGPGPASTSPRPSSAENIHFARKQRERLERKYAGNPSCSQQELRRRDCSPRSTAPVPARAVQRDPRVPRRGHAPAVAPGRRRDRPGHHLHGLLRRVRHRRHGRRGRRGLLLPGGLLRAVLARPADAASSPRRTTATTRTAWSARST